jgi:hypothetical protein
MGFRNLAFWDRAARAAIGVSMLLAGWTGTIPGVWGIALAVFGWAPLATSVAGWCPVYSLLGTSSRKSKPPAR